MNTLTSKKSYLISLGMLFLVLLSGCSSPVEQLTVSPTIPTANVQPGVETTSPTPSENLGGYSAEQIRSLESLVLLDDYPLYTMHYYGNYPLSNGGFTNVDLMAGENQTTMNWACSLFSSFSGPNGGLYGRNFDWEFSPALLLFTDPPGGFSSVSMVDIAYLGFAGSRSRQLTELPIENLYRLLNAPYLPFDGMNEYGLVVGMAAVPESASPDHPELETIDSLMVIRLMLDQARNVDEALEIFERYNLDWGSGPALHYLVADRTGRSILLEYFNGEMIVIENQQAWQAATNFLQSAHSGKQSGVCSRFDRLSERLGASGGEMTPSEALQLLEDVSQSNTQWSVIYGMLDGMIRIVMGREYAKVYILELEMGEGDGRE